MSSTSPAPRTNTLALVGFIAAFTIPIVGIVLGALALGQLRAPGNQESGAGLARWALVIGSILTLATVIFFIFWLSMFFSILDGRPIGS